MINSIKPNVWQLCFRDFGSCVYLIKLRRDLILIDTSSKDCEQELLRDLKKLNISPEEINKIILTHFHHDHIENISLFPNAIIYSRKNINELDIPEFKIIHTPGHTREDICILYDDILFSGDVIFNDGYIGRTDFPESSPKEMPKSLEKIKKLNYKILAPGHLI